MLYVHAMWVSRDYCGWTHASQHYIITNHCLGIHTMIAIMYTHTCIQATHTHT